MFMDALQPAHRALFEGAAQRLSLARGGYLMRKGDPSGDVYLIRSGGLEVVDRRNSPEVVLATVGPGSLVGEMAFLDDAPRSADVRASADCEVLRWSRDDLRGLLARHPDLAAAFFEGVARLASQRIRQLSEGAAAGAFARDNRPQGEDALRELVATLAEPLKRELPALDTALKRDAEDTLAVGRLIGLLEDLERATSAAYEDTIPDHRAASWVAAQLGRELHPWLVRSLLAARCLARPHGASGSAEILAHLLVDRSGGDGPLGEHIDRWLLDRPTFRAMRSFRGPLVERVHEALPTHRNRRILVVNAGTGSTVARLAERLSTPPTSITVVDSSRDALSFLDPGLTRGAALHTVQQDLIQLAVGRSRLSVPPHDAVVLHGLLEYMPARIAVSLLRECRGWLAPHGVVVAATLGPSGDSAFLDRLLRWPTIRRSVHEVTDLFAAAGLPLRSVDALEHPGLLAVASADATAAAAPLA
jgi:CRP-like cAMP-binding protein/SAM-dependent methyltransferase